MLSTLIFFLIVFLIYFFIKQYNLLQNLTVEIKEARANIIVAYEKKGCYRKPIYRSCK